MVAEKTPNRKEETQKICIKRKTINQMLQTQVQKEESRREKDEKQSKICIIVPPFPLEKTRRDWVRLRAEAKNTISQKDRERRAWDSFHEGFKATGFEDICTWKKENFVEREVISEAIEEDVGDVGSFRISMGCNSRPILSGSGPDRLFRVNSNPI